MVLDVPVEEQREVMGQEQLYQQLRVVITSGTRRGEVLEVENGDLAMVNVVRYRVGDRVFLQAIPGEDGSTRYVIDGYSRWRPLVWAAVIFVAVVALSAGWRSITSLLGLGFSFAVVLAYILPRLAAGHDPVSTVLIGGTVIIPSPFTCPRLFGQDPHGHCGHHHRPAITVWLTQYFTGLTELTGAARTKPSLCWRPAGYRHPQPAHGRHCGGRTRCADDITIPRPPSSPNCAGPTPPGHPRSLSRRHARGPGHITSMINTRRCLSARRCRCSCCCAPVRCAHLPVQQGVSPKRSCAW